VTKKACQKCDQFAIANKLNDQSIYLKKRTSLCSKTYGMKDSKKGSLLLATLTYIYNARE